MSRDAKWWNGLVTDAIERWKPRIAEIEKRYKDGLPLTEKLTVKQLIAAGPEKARELINMAVQQQATLDPQTGKVVHIPADLLALIVGYVEATAEARD